MFGAHRRVLGLAIPALIAVLVGSIVIGPPAGAAQAPVGLGTATSFAVLAGSAITNTGVTTITGDIGSYPTATITDSGAMVLSPGSVNHAGDPVTQGAKGDLQTAYTDAASRLPVVSVGVDLAGVTLTPGVYSNGTLGLTGVLTLDFQNDPTSQFVFQAGSTLITGPGASVVMINTTGGDACRVVWQVGSSATFDTTTSFVGDVLAYTSISAYAGATFLGRLLALNGAVTLINNTINRGSCATIAATPTTTPIVLGGGGGPLTIPTTSTTSSTTSTTRPPRSTTTTSSSTTSTTVAPTTTTTAAPTATTTVASSPATVTPGTVVPVPFATTGAVRSSTGSGVQLGAPAIVTGSSIQQLPRTGDDVMMLAMIGSGMVLLGSTMVRVQRDCCADGRPNAGPARRRRNRSVSRARSGPRRRA